MDLRSNGYRAAMDKPALKALSLYHYDYVDAHRARVGPVCHVLYSKYAYSIPHVLTGSHIDTGASVRLVREWNCGCLAPTGTVTE